MGENLIQLIPRTNRVVIMVLRVVTAGCTELDISSGIVNPCNYLDNCVYDKV